MKHILTLLTTLMLSFTAFAMDKLFVLNSGSTGGSFNGQMTAYIEDLKEFYDIEYVQGKGCNKASATIDKILENGHQVFYIWNGLRAADYLNGKNPACGKLANEENFVNSVLKYGMFFTQAGGISPEEMLQDGMTVAYNSNTNFDYLTALAAQHGVTWNLVRYENSKGVVLGVLNGEVDFGMTNSAKSFYSKSDKLQALYTLNPDGENGILPLASVSDFAGADKGIADLFLIEGGDNAELRAIVKQILADPNSTISTWYSTAKGYTQTIDLPVKEGAEISNNAISKWAE